MGLAESRKARWLAAGGILGAFFVLSSLVLAPRLGATAFVSATVVGTVAASLIIDHYGFLAYRVQPITALLFLVDLVEIYRGSDLYGPLAEPAEESEA